MKHTLYIYDTITLSPVPINDVTKITIVIKAIAPNRWPEPYHVFPTLDHVAAGIIHIVNLSLHTNVSPAPWGIVSILPLPKVQH